MEVDEAEAEMFASAGGVKRTFNILPVLSKNKNWWTSHCTKNEQTCAHLAADLLAPPLQI